MAEYTRVCWAEADEAWLVEDDLISRLSLPLNLAGNRRHVSTPP
jgi:hypothetical protein